VWAQKSIENYFDVGSSKRVLQQDWATQGIPFYRTRELVSLSKGEPFSSEIFIAEKLFDEIIEKYGAPKEGDFLVSGVGTLGISYLVKSNDKFYFKDGNVLWFAKREHISSKFFKYCFESDGIQNQITKQASVSTVGTYTIQNAKTTNFLTPPSTAEQQKIANCLSSLDELIAAQARKVEALKTHKKGLMQQLFPSEGETQPRLRFPEFQNAEDWEMKSLGSFSKVGDIDHKMPSSIANGIPYIMTGDFFGINDIDYENAKKISIEDYQQLSKKIKPELGDIVIARYASVGAVRYIQTRLKFLASYSCAVIKCNKLEDSRYIYYALQSDVIQSQIRLEINTSSQKNIGIDSIKKLIVFLPTLSEQLKISACLAVLDAQITAKTQQLDALKTHKKGLMQQLFPAPEATEV
jgi:type I restriction enzyme S subunit